MPATVTISLEADDNASAHVQKLTAELANLEKITNSVIAMAERYSTTLQQLTGQSQAISQQFGQTGQATQQVSEALKETGQAAQQAASTATGAGQAFGQMSNQASSGAMTVSQLKAAFNAATQEVSQLGKQVDVSKEHLSQLKNEVSRLEIELAKSKQTTNADADETKKLQEQLNQARLAVKEYQLSITGLNDSYVRAKRDAKEYGEQLDQVERNAKNAKGGTSSLTDAMQHIGPVSAAMTNPLTAFAQVVASIGSASIKAAAEVETAVANISTIKPEIDTKLLNQQLTELSTRIPQSASEIGEGLYDIFSSIDNISQDTAVKLEEIFAKGATAARTDAQTFGTAITGVLNAYKMNVSEADHVSDVFFKTVQNGVVTGKELAASLGPVTEAAKYAGVSLNELGAALAAVTKEGGPAAQNINNLNNFFQKLTTKEAQDGFHNLGIATTDASGKFRNFADVLADLKVRLAGMTEAQRANALQTIFPDAQARQGAQVLISQLENVKKWTEENTKAYGTSEEAYKKMSQTFEAQSKLLANTLQGLAKDVGNAMLPAATALAKGAADAIKSLDDSLRPALEKIEPLIEGISIKITPILKGIGQAFGEYILPYIEKVQQGIQTAISILEPAFKKVGDALKGVGLEVKDVGGFLGSTFQVGVTAAATAISFVVERVSDLINIFNGIKPILEIALKPMAAAFDAVRTAVKTVIDAVAGFPNPWQKQAQDIKKMWEEGDKAAETYKGMGLAFNVLGEQVKKSDENLASLKKKADETEQALNKLLDSGKKGPELQKAFDDNKKAQEALKSATESNKKAHDDLSKGLDQLEKNLDAARKKYEEVQKAASDNKATLDDLKNAHDAVTVAEKDLSDAKGKTADATKKATDATKEQNQVNKEQAVSQEKIAQVLKDISGAYDQLMKAAKTAGDEAGKAMQSAAEGLQQAQEKVAEAQARIHQVVEESQNAINEAGYKLQESQAQVAEYSEALRKGQEEVTRTAAEEKTAIEASTRATEELNRVTREYNALQGIADNLAQNQKDQGYNIRAKEAQLKEFEAQMMDAKIAKDTNRQAQLTAEMARLRAEIAHETAAMEQSSIAADKAKDAAEKAGRAKAEAAKKAADAEKDAQKATKDHEQAIRNVEKAQRDLEKATHATMLAQIALNKAQQTGETNYNKALEELSKAQNDLEKNAKKAAGQIQGDFKASADAMSNTARQIPANFQQAANQASQLVQNGLSTGLATAAQQGMNAMNVQVQSAMAQIQTSYAVGGQQAATAFNQGIAGTAQGAAEAMQKVRDEVANGLKATEELVKQQTEQIKADFSKMSEGMSSIRQVLEEIKTLIREMIEAVKQAFSSARSSIPSSAHDLGVSTGNSLAQGIRESTPDAVAAAQDMANQVNGALANAADAGKRAFAVANGRQIGPGSYDPDNDPTKHNDDPSGMKDALNWVKEMQERQRKQAEEEAEKARQDTAKIYWDALHPGQPFPGVNDDGTWKQQPNDPKVGGDSSGRYTGAPTGRSGATVADTEPSEDYEIIPLPNGKYEVINRKASYRARHAGDGKSGKGVDEEIERERAALNAFRNRNQNRGDGSLYAGNMGQGQGGNSYYAQWLANQLKKQDQNVPTFLRPPGAVDQSTFQINMSMDGQRFAQITNNGQAQGFRRTNGSDMFLFS